MAGWGEVEVEPEVAEWIGSLSADEVGRVAFYVDLLAREGPLLGEPYTRQLSGKLRERRFYLGRQRYRIAYYIATGRRIILLTVFFKTQQQARGEVRRAQDAMDVCIAEGHTAEE